MRNLCKTDSTLPRSRSAGGRASAGSPGSPVCPELPGITLGVSAVERSEELGYYDFPDGLREAKWLGQ